MPLLCTVGTDLIVKPWMYPSVFVLVSAGGVHLSHLKIKEGGSDDSSFSLDLFSIVIFGVQLQNMCG